MKFRFLIFTPLLLAVSCSPFLAGTRSEEGITEDVSQRTLGAWITDSSIAARIRTNLQKQEPVLGEANIDVTSHMGIVLLVGQVPSPELKRRAVEIASEASTQIRRIHDELEVTGNTGLLTRLDDTSISGRVRFLLATDETVGGANIRSVTENGTVYLLGVVDRELGDQAATLVSDVNGVARVVKIFEYLN